MSDFLERLDILVRRDIAERESRCRFCGMELKEDALGLEERHHERFVEYTRSHECDDGRTRSERYRFCCRGHMDAYRRMERS